MLKLLAMDEIERIFFGHNFYTFLSIE